MLMKISPDKLLLLMSGLIAAALGLPAMANSQTDTIAIEPSAIAQSPSPVPANARQKLAEQFLDLVFSQQYEKATEYISPTIKNEFPASVIRQKADSFQKLNGTFVRRLNSESDGDVIVVNLLFNKNPRAVIITFDDNLKIINADYFIQSANSPTASPANLLSTPSTKPATNPLPNPPTNPLTKPPINPTINPPLK
jgi:hypothetical protein